MTRGCLFVVAGGIYGAVVFVLSLIVHARNAGLASGYVAVHTLPIGHYILSEDLKPADPRASAKDQATLLGRYANADIPRDTAVSTDKLSSAPMLDPKLGYLALPMARDELRPNALTGTVAADVNGDVQVCIAKNAAAKGRLAAVAFCPFGGPKPCQVFVSLAPDQVANFAAAYKDAKEARTVLVVPATKTCG
jgi:hypothetical protein